MQKKYAIDKKHLNMLQEPTDMDHDNIYTDHCRDGNYRLSPYSGQVGIEPDK